MKKQDAIRKIKALLALTTQNGAGEQEALSALDKAQELMQQHYISEYELNEGVSLSQCVAFKTKRHRSSYCFEGVLNDLSRLFDCKYFYNNHHVTFFGFEDDVQLCAYLYDFIVSLIRREIKKYQKTSEFYYHREYEKIHGRTLTASFVKGFIYGIASKMKEMYKSKKSNVSQKHGLIVLEKEDIVQNKFDASFGKIKIVKDKRKEIISSIFNSGFDKGENASIHQGVKSEPKAEVLQLEM